MDPLETTVAAVREIGPNAVAIDDGGTAAVVYRDDEPLHEDRLAALAAADVDVFVLAEETPLVDAAEAAVTGASGEQVFIYGFGEFVDDAEAAIEAAGGDPSNAKTENFG